MVRSNLLCMFLMRSSIVILELTEQASQPVKFHPFSNGLWCKLSFYFFSI